MTVQRSAQAEARTERDDLSRLVGALAAGQGITARVCRGQNGMPVCQIANAADFTQVEQVSIADGCFMFSWGETIGSVADVGSAVVSIIRVVKDPAF